MCGESGALSVARRRARVRLAKDGRTNGRRKQLVKEGRRGGGRASEAKKTDVPEGCCPAPTAADADALARLLRHRGSKLLHNSDSIFRRRLIMLALAQLSSPASGSLQMATTSDSLCSGPLPFERGDGKAFGVPRCRVAEAAG